MSAPSSGANPGGANEIADAAARAGIGRVHAFAWRDLEDAEVTVCAVALAGGDNAPGRVGTMCA